MQTAAKTQFGELLAQRKESLFYLEKQDRRMRFNNSKDPIYFAFDYLESKPVSTLAKEFYIHKNKLLRITYTKL